MQTAAGVPRAQQRFFLFGTGPVAGTGTGNAQDSDGKSGTTMNSLRFFILLLCNEHCDEARLPIALPFFRR